LFLGKGKRREGKEVKATMRRIVKILAAAALMVVLMATTVSPVFAQPEHAGEYGFGTDKKKQEITTGNEGIGYACGQQRDVQRC
jgi:hypothetical protein